MWCTPNVGQDSVDRNHVADQQVELVEGKQSVGLFSGCSVELDRLTQVAHALHWFIKVAVHDF